MNPDATTTTDLLLAALRHQTGIEDLTWARIPQPLSGGFWAEMYDVELGDSTGQLTGRFVARIMPDPDTAEFETAVQRYVNRCGLSVPGDPRRRRARRTPRPCLDADGLRVRPAPHQRAQRNERDTTGPHSAPPPPLCPRLSGRQPPPMPDRRARTRTRRPQPPRRHRRLSATPRGASRLHQPPGPRRHRPTPRFCCPDGAGSSATATFTPSTSSSKTTSGPSSTGQPP